MSIRCFKIDFSFARLLSMPMSSPRKVNTSPVALAPTSIALKDHRWLLLYSSLSSLAV